ncbi:MAG: hypothetical protein A2Y33_00045 [Spirochaetes bacterium GWF1_51_8]|nr:MAG: hypothetical protein A2Y33_00045 [Spirochaetes bacterium GWF1_51_8]
MEKTKAILQEEKQPGTTAETRRPRRKAKEVTPGKKAKPKSQKCSSQSRDKLRYEDAEVQRNTNSRE